MDHSNTIYGITQWATRMGLPGVLVNWISSFPSMEVTAVSVDSTTSGFPIKASVDLYKDSTQDILIALEDSWYRGGFFPEYIMNKTETWKEIKEKEVLDKDIMSLVTEGAQGSLRNHICTELFKRRLSIC